MTPKVYLDMDGVLADFQYESAKWHIKANPYLDPKNLGVWELEEIWGITPEQFWKPIDNFEFWSNLPKTKEADWIVEEVERRFGRKNVAIATSPSKSEACFTGKRAWLRRNYPQFKDNIFFGKEKQFLAGENRWLLDDRDKNLDAFSAEGGQAIIIPRPWNSWHWAEGNFKSFVHEALEISFHQEAGKR